MTDQSLERPHRRGFLQCMTWAGAGVAWSVADGVPGSVMLGEADAAAKAFTFVQVSDSHIGIAKSANPDASSPLQRAEHYLPSAA